MRPTQFALDSGWQGGEAHLEIEGDVIAAEGDVEIDGVIFKLVTPLDMSEESEVRIALGAGELLFPVGHGQLEFTFAARDEQARAIAHAILAATGDEAVTRMT